MSKSSFLLAHNQPANSIIQHRTHQHKSPHNTVHPHPYMRKCITNTMNIRNCVCVWLIDNVCFATPHAIPKQSLRSKFHFQSSRFFVRAPNSNFDCGFICMWRKKVPHSQQRPTNYFSFNLKRPPSATV